MNIDIILNKLSKSTFRNRFHLKEKDIKYIDDKGIDVIREHTLDFINKRLAPAVIPNDGKQTPMRGHPTFIAQHATATCCRGCLSKWHRIQPNCEISDKDKEYIADIIMKWIDKEYRN